MEIQFNNHITAETPEKIRQICLSTGFFREDEVEVAVELAREALEKGQEESGYYFLLAETHGEVIGFVCFGPTPCTLGTYDLYWIVVDDRYRGKGTGMELLVQTENALQILQARKLYIETSSTAKYQPTRNFYLKGGYTEEARLKDFYAAGDDKVIFARNL